MATKKAEKNAPKIWQTVIRILNKKELLHQGRKRDLSPLSQNAISLSSS